MKSIAFSNQKGGVAKTTTALNLGCILAGMDLRVLLIDLDPQASLSKNLLGEEILENKEGLEELFLNENLDPVNLISQTKTPNLDILPSHTELASVSAKVLLDSGSFFMLKGMMDRFAHYDYVLMDTPPNLGVLTLNALTASEHLIVPVSPALYSLLGINDLMQSFEKTRRNLNPGLKLLGVLVTMKDKRATVYRQIEGELREFFGDKVFRTVISRLAKSEEAIVEGLGVSSLDPKCRLAGEYRQLAEEVLARLGQSELVAEQGGAYGQGHTER